MLPFVCLIPQHCAVSTLLEVLVSTLYSDVYQRPKSTMSTIAATPPVSGARRLSFIQLMIRSLGFAKDTSILGSSLKPKMTKEAPALMRICRMRPQQRCHLPWRFPRQLFLT
jgi:hypothetical protein